MKQYQDLMRLLLDAPFKGDRTGTGTYSIFGHQMRFDLQKGFPLVTTKKVPFHLIIKELLWFLEGNTNAHHLADQGCHIWDEWATEDGDLGPIYGKQWRSWQRPVDARKLMDEINTLRRMVYSSDHDMDDVKDQINELETIVAAADPIDQIREVIHMIKTKPNSRRLIVSAWNPVDMPDETISPQENVKEGRMALAACHTLFQFYVHDRDWNDVLNDLIATDFEFKGETAMDIHWKKTRDLVSSFKVDDTWIDATVHGGTGYRHPDYYRQARAIARECGIRTKKLSCQLYQRSCDSFLGLPFNIASYALLTHMIAQVCDLDVGEFIWTGGDTHIYSNHVEQTKELISREPKPLPTLKLNPEIKDIDAFTLDDIELVDYQSHPAIKGKVSV